MNKNFVLALACCAAFSGGIQYSYADPHELYKSGELVITGGADFEVQLATRIQNQKYQKRFIKKDGTAYDATKETSIPTDGKVARLGITKNNQDIAALTNAGAYFGARNKAENGWIYGMHVGLFTNVRAGNLPVKDDHGRTYAYFQHDKWGRFEIGTKKGVSKTMGIDADDISTATSGIDGAWSTYLDLNTYDTDGTTRLLNGDNFTDGIKLIYKDNDKKSNHEGNRKITYYTPRFSNGVQVGVTYIPDSSNKGVSGDGTLQPFPNDQGPSRRLKNLVALAVGWEHKIDEKRKLELEVDGEIAKLMPSIADNIANRRYYPAQAYHTGLKYIHDKASFAVSYGNRGKIFKYKRSADGVKDSQFMTAGVAYKFTDKLSASLGYFHSWNRNTLDIYSVGAEYKWLPGVKPYAEYTYVTAKQKYNYDPQDPKSTNLGNPGKCSVGRYKGGVAIVGAKFSL